MNPDYSPSNNPTIMTNDTSSPKKKRLLFAGAVVLLVAIIAVGAVLLHNPSSKEDSASAVAISSTVADVNVSATGYMPQTITVKQGQQVTFTNSDSTPRQLTADATALPGFSTVEPLDQGDTYTYIFDTKGTFKYYDASDPTHFVGTVIVK